MSETVACYVRVSTEEQTLDRQTSATREYAADHLGADTVEMYTDASTGTNTDRDGYRRLMADAEAGEIDTVVVHEVSRIARSVRDLSRTVDRLEAADVGLHILENDMTLRPADDDPYQRALFQLLGVFAELEAQMTRKRVREGIAARLDEEGYHHGPAPLGFEKDGDGGLIEADDYDRVCAVLEMVAKGDLSKRQAAVDLDCGRKTVRRSLTDRPELYGV